ncbi:MAG: hypothetical protein IPG63_08910 [Xanthomonadales bacterium]|nr:hypothetical protein [Xanthomonadales bacterium]MBK7144513.1 hypothetical protein [Xanthomonadales bacterium]
MTKIVELKPKSIPARLREALRERTLVRVWREHLEPGSFTGYIAAVGKDRFLLWALGDYIGFDGLFVLRYRDVTRLEAPDHHADFLEKAIKLRKLTPELPIAFPLDDLQQIVAAAAERAPVTSFYVDTEAETEVCYIGKLLAFEAEGFTVQEVSPHAEWLREPSFFGWDEVSCVSINEPYALALVEVAGTPPPLEQTSVDHRTWH